jgi:hypothetical protein
MKNLFTKEMHNTESFTYFIFMQMKKENFFDDNVTKPTSLDGCWERSEIHEVKQKVLK